ncbi:translation elongation factor Ts [Nitratireductor pacificus]|uniref:Elongation factor Ts n=1 Tax=Nitratireductor pacificus pht-3B TaxID=391937 RepID=K2LNN9_9HYPH|nr:translation elongation factor Ts [Nitratireductor pacificus]EKF19384.1 elongation factor Ts [Nitratireductor pacificus pht-3B]
MPKPDIQLIKALRERTAAGVMDCKRALIAAEGNLDRAAESLRATMRAATRVHRRPTPEGVVACVVRERRGALIELRAETDFVSRNAQFQTAAGDLARIALEAGGDLARTLDAPSPDGRDTVAGYLHHLSARFGEAVTLHRTAGIDTPEGCLGAYAHNGPTPDVGRMAALVSVSGGGASVEIARRLAMHVVGAAPLWTSPDDVPASVRELKHTGSGDGSGDANESHRVIQSRLDRFYGMTVLLHQPFLFDPGVTVAEALADAAGDQARVDGFVCFRVGEDAAHDARVAQAAAFEWTFGNDWSSEAPAHIREVGEVRIFEVSPNGPKLRDDRDAVDLINAAWSLGITFIALPTGRLPGDFFPLSTRKAGTILQKFSNLGARLAIVGDVSVEVAESAALRDFIHEANRGEHVWFVPDFDSLMRRLNIRARSG